MFDGENCWPTSKNPHQDKVHNDVQLNSLELGDIIDLKQSEIKPNGNEEFIDSEPSNLKSNDKKKKGEGKEQD